MKKWVAEDRNYYEFEAPDYDTALAKANSRFRGSVYDLREKKQCPDCSKWVDRYDDKEWICWDCKHEIN
jgi:ribosomal protein L37AE/L43A